MKFLKSAEHALKPGTFKATYTSGATSDNHRVACFFMQMQEHDLKVEEVESKIRIGKLIDHQTDWAEAERIIKTFKGKK